MWYFGAVRIYVQDKGSSGKQIIARLQPFDTGTVQQRFGYETPVQRLSCVVVGEDDMESIRNMTISGVAFPLSGYGTYYGEFFLSSFDEKRSPFPFQTIRQDLDCETPVFNVELELT